jgi:hypothetical protein
VLDRRMPQTALHLGADSEIAKLPDVRERIKQLGLIPDGSTAAALRDRISRDIPK